MMGVGQGRMYQGHFTKDTHKKRANLPWLRSQYEFFRHFFEPKGHSKNRKKANLALRIKPQINCTPVFTINISKTQAIWNAHTIGGRIPRESGNELPSMRCQCYFSETCLLHSTCLTLSSPLNALQLLFLSLN